MSTKMVVGVPVEKDFSKAQTEHFNELQGEFTRAQAALQRFTNYLSKEHELNEVELAPGWEWRIGPKGFVAVFNHQGMATEAPPSEDAQAGNGEKSTAPQE